MEILIQLRDEHDTIAQNERIAERAREFAGRARKNVLSVAADGFDSSKTSCFRSHLVPRNAAPLPER
jgi:hypothetical protein